MDSTIALDLTSVGIIFLLILAFVLYQICTYSWLRAHGTHMVALITRVQRGGTDLTRRTCLVTAAGNDPQTNRRRLFEGVCSGTQYREGQLISILLDPNHPSRYIIEE